MWWKETGKISVKASTLAELLVVMIVTSILLLAVTDGLSLFARYSRSVTEKIIRHGEIWNHYCRLESLIVPADSLSEDPKKGGISIHSSENAGKLSVWDSTLLFSKGSTTDTLFRSTIDIGISAAPDGNDSLVVLLTWKENRLRIAFAPEPKPRATTPESYHLEQEYRYE